MASCLKSEISAYWTGRTDSFAQLRRDEFDSAKRAQWEAELLHLLPRRDGLHILDVGTGTGFFALILAAMGHEVTGIDLTESMILRAREESVRRNLPATFLVMDAENPAFPDEAFDAVVTRNLTWSLPHLEAAYRQWHRMLKSGGVLINFDADYCREQAAQALPACHAHKAITADQAAEYEHLKSELRPTQHPRPEWDCALLKQIGFSEIRVDNALSQRLYAQTDAFFNPTPMFALSAVK